MEDLRTMPHDEAAEKALIGAVLRKKDAFLDAAQLLPEDFYEPSHREIWKAIRGAVAEGKAIDAVTIADILKKDKSLEVIGGKDYLDALIATPGGAVGEYAEIIGQHARARAVVALAGDLQDAGFAGADPGELLAKAEQGVFEISQRGQARSYIKMADTMADTMAAVRRAMQAKDGLTGLTSGFTDLDRYTKGLHNGDLVILAARPAMGKTALAVTIARNAAKRQDASVLIFSMEMGHEQLGERLLAMESGVDMQKMRGGKLSPEEYEKIERVSQDVGRYKIMIDDISGMTTAEMRSKAKRAKLDGGLDLIVIDYLQLMGCENKRDGNRTQELSTITRRLKLMARELNVPVIVLSQLSRAPEQREDHRPKLSDLRESGSIEQDADLVLMLYRDGYYNPDEDDGTTELIISKQRSGPTGMVKIAFLPQYVAFANLERMERGYQNE